MPIEYARIDYQPAPPIARWEEASVRALVLRRVADPHDARLVLEVLGLADDLPPLPPRAEGQPAPATTPVPPSPEVVAARAAAADRRRQAAVDYFHSQGLRGRALDTALADLEA